MYFIHPLQIAELYFIVSQEPYDHRVKDLGSIVELSIDHLFMTNGHGQLKYQWSRIINDEEEKIEDEECFKNSDSKVMVIDGFETKYAGTYQCVISTSSQLVLSMSAVVELDLPGQYKHNNIVKFSRTIIILAIFCSFF